MFVESRHDEQKGMGRDSCGILVREEAVGANRALLGSACLTSYSYPQSHGENDSLTAAAG